MQGSRLVKNDESRSIRQEPWAFWGLRFLFLFWGRTLLFFAQGLSYRAVHYFDELAVFSVNELLR